MLRVEFSTHISMFGCPNRKSYESYLISCDLLCPVVVLSLQMTYLGCLWLVPTPRSKSAFYGALLSAGTGKRDAREWDPML